ncbi:hypothetical protein RFI_17097 [Reticulomyxa filosa]|uniref:CAP-Gly domain-containing protein n=1 Tax=Reticulomyxa filosa TaxID=46433 RepID=X6N1G4_RETFI|nr:hypothetical protein RFI_17097 [Reticulomyxa filosa]|eukprot:ETO20120.1 hypothetical protein RFI_17097 [Reticulomyxa filosa]
MSNYTKSEDIRETYIFSYWKRKGRFPNIPREVKRLIGRYYLSHFFPGTGSQVWVESKSKVQESVNLVNRIDYWPSMNKHCGDLGKVIDHHPTNGILIRFEDNECVWYEPCSVVQLSGTVDVVPVRLFCGDKVKCTSKEVLRKFGNEFRWDTETIEEVGTIAIHTDFEKEKPHKLSLQKNEKKNPDLSLELFPIGSKVKIKSHPKEVQKGFDLANRNDYWKWMDNFCDKVGEVIRHHPTNGIQVKVGTQFIWFEPPCFVEQIDTSTDSKKPTPSVFSQTNPPNSNKMERLLVGTRVIFHKDTSPYHLRTGFIALHFLPRTGSSYDQITVRFADTDLYVDPQDVQLINSFAKKKPNQFKIDTCNFFSNNLFKLYNINLREKKKAENVENLREKSRNKECKKIKKQEKNQDGKHNGKVRNRAYFNCAENHGIFVQSKDIVTVLKSLVKRVTYVVKTGGEGKGPHMHIHVKKGNTKKKKDSPIFKKCVYIMQKKKKKKGNSEVKQIPLNEMVIVNNYGKGRVRFVGQTMFDETGIWYGIELIDRGDKKGAMKGNTNGSIDNIVYFKCDQQSGVFVRANQLKLVAENG